MTGSIAAYKAVEVARLCVKAGATVVPLMTASAQRFVGAVTLAGITGQPVITDMWDAAFPGEAHVAIAERADILVLVPATADVLSRLAQGRADDLITAAVLCARGPVLAVPAMHPRMWQHPATQRNVEELLRQGRVTLVGPVDGQVASGESGLGRMEAPSEIVRAIERALESSVRDLCGRHVVVTAGPTHEPIDPVRYLGNRSSGRMGFAIAARAAARGANVTLVAGPVALPTPAGVTRVNVETARQMQRAVAEAMGDDLGKADALVMAAAVADFCVAAPSASKLKKGSGLPTLTLAANPDILAEIGRKRVASLASTPVLVGFALETGDDAAVLRQAIGKLDTKHVDLVVANAAHESLGHATNRVSLVSREGVGPFTRGTKENVADWILAEVSKRLRG